MQIVDKQIEILAFPKNPAQRIAKAARICYQSPSKENESGFITGLWKSGHHTPFEHVSATVEVRCSRATSHELVRHRIGVSFNQESQRYCNYSKNGVTFIRPQWAYKESYASDTWENSCEYCETVYLALMGFLNNRSEFAREVLPESTATKLILTANFREWNHILNLRCIGTTGRPHPEIKSLTTAIYRGFHKLAPTIFDLDFPEPFDTKDITDYERIESC